MWRWKEYWKRIEFGNRHKPIRNFMYDKDGTPSRGAAMGVPFGNVKLDPCFTSRTKINFKWINCFKCERLNKKILEENMGKCFLI